MSLQQAAQAVAPQYRFITGVVVSSGRMMKTVKVRIPKQVWNKKIQKFYPSYDQLLVSDPTDSVRTGDLVSIRSGWRTSKHTRHVVASIIAPMGPSLDQRPALPTMEEREADKAAQRIKKDERRAAIGVTHSIYRVALHKFMFMQLEAEMLGASKELFQAEQSEVEHIQEMKMKQYKKIPTERATQHTSRLLDGAENKLVAAMRKHKAEFEGSIPDLGTADKPLLRAKIDGPGASNTSERTYMDVAQTFTQLRHEYAREVDRTITSKEQRDKLAAELEAVTGNEAKSVELGALLEKEQEALKVLSRARIDILAKERKLAQRLHLLDNSASYTPEGARVLPRVLAELRRLHLSDASNQKATPTHSPRDRTSGRPQTGSTSWADIMKANNAMVEQEAAIKHGGLPESGPPGGQTAVHSINERARNNVGRAMKYNDKALKNEADLADVTDKVEGKLKSADKVPRGRKITSV